MILCGVVTPENHIRLELGILWGYPFGIRTVRALKGNSALCIPLDLARTAMSWTQMSQFRSSRRWTRNHLWAKPSGFCSLRAKQLRGVDPWKTVMDPGSRCGHRTGTKNGP